MVKGKPSTPARIVLKGRVKGPPEVTQKSGTTVITKEVEDAEIEETFPRRRKTGKQKPVKQLVPAEDVMRIVEEERRALASGSAKHHEAALNRKVGLLSDMASKEIDKARTQAKKEKKRADFTKQRLAATRKYVERERFDREFDRIVNPGGSASSDSRLEGRRALFRAAPADLRVDRPKRARPPSRYPGKTRSEERRMARSTTPIPPATPLHDSLM